MGGGTNRGNVILYDLNVLVAAVPRLLNRLELALLFHCCKSRALEGCNSYCMLLLLLPPPPLPAVVPALSLSFVVVALVWGEYTEGANTLAELMDMPVEKLDTVED